MTRGAAVPCFINDKMITEQTVTEYCEAFLSGTPYFLVEVTVKPAGKIAVFIDGDQRVTVEVCRDMNRFLEEKLDRDNNDFDLTVSSAGIDKPLKLLRQFSKNLNRELDIVLISGTRMNAVLTGINGSLLTFMESKKQKKQNTENIPFTVDFEEIKSAKEIITFKS